MTEGPAVWKYPGVVNPHQMVQRYLMAHQGTATVYLSYRAQGGGRAGLSGVRQVLDVTGAKADDFPVSQNRGRKTFCTCSYAHDRKATPAAAWAWAWAWATER